MRPDDTSRALLAEELARRLNSLLPERVRVIAGPGARLGVDEADAGQWGGVDLYQVNYDSLEELVFYALDSIQDSIAHAVNGAWPPLGATRLNVPWVRREGDSLRLGFEGGIELEPIALSELKAS